MHDNLIEAKPAATPDTPSAEKLPRRDSVLSSSERFLSRLPAFRAAVYGSTGGIEVVGVQVAAVVLWLMALAARFVLDPYLPPGFPYLTFFPAVIITGFVFGMYPATTCAILSGVSAWYWFIPPYDSIDIDGQTMMALIFFIVVVAIDLSLLRLAFSAYAAQARARRQLAEALDLQDVVSQEVDHRIKNLLATVSGLISLSQKHASTPAELARQLRQRIGAMGNAISMLRDSLHGGEADMRATVAAALEPLGIAPGETQDSRLQVSGPKIVLNSAALMAINLILHELGTNALKYGALSNETGKIAIDWRDINGADDDAMFDLNWQEIDGPTVSVPGHTGFGTELARRMSASLGGRCDFEFKEDGLAVRVTMSRARASV
ncbi:MAG: sensor histidine kinase [Pseudorhizobium sp.]